MRPGAIHNREQQVLGKRLLDSGVQQLLGALLMTAQAVLSARWLGAGAKGALTLAMQLASIGAILFMFGLPSALAAAASRETLAGRQILRVWVGASSFAFALALIGRVFLDAVLSPAYDTALWILPAAVVVVSGATTILGLAYAWGDTRTALLASTCSGSALVAFYSVAYFLGFQRNPRIAALLWMASAFLGLIVGTIRLKSRLWSGRAHIGIRDLTGRLRVGLQSMFGQALVVLNARFDVMLLALFVSSDQVGVYSVAVSMVQIIQLLGVAVAQASTHHLGQGALEPEALARFFRTSVFVSIISGFAVCALGWVLVPLLFGRGFEAAASMVAVMSVPFGLYASSVVASQYALHRLDRPAYQSQIVGLTLTCDLFSALFLMPKYGAMGASIASAVSYIIGGIYNVYAMSKWSDSRLRNILIPRKKDFKFISELFGFSLRNGR